MSFESNGTYSASGVMAGTNLVEDLKDTSCKKGICAISPGWILIEFNDIFEFEEIEAAGWNGNTTIWAVGNGAGTPIFVSEDKITWEQVGTLDGLCDTIILIKLTKRCSAQYIKFVSTGYLGLGYLNIKTD